MSSGQCVKKQITPIRVEQMQPELAGLSSKGRKSASKSHPRARDIPVNGWRNVASSKNEGLPHPNRGHGISSKRSATGSKHAQLSEVNLLLAQKSETAEAFVNQKLYVGKFLSKEGANCQSRQFLDALEVLNSNKELFLKLLEDPNSLLAKHIQDLRDSAGKERAKSLSEDKRSECGLRNAKELEGTEDTKKSGKKNGHRPFWKKIKWDRYSSKRSSNHQTSDTIEVSEPRLTRVQPLEGRKGLFPSQQHQFGSRNNWQNGKNDTGHAVKESRKQHYCIPMDDAFHPYYDLRGSEFIGKWIVGKVAGRSSQLDTGNADKSSTDVRRRKEMGRPKDLGLGIEHENGSTSGSGSKSLNISATKYSKQKESSIYLEAKRHLFEMLSKDGKDKLSSTREVMGPLGTILSLPGYDLSPKLSPRWETERGFVTAEMRSSPYSTSQTGPQNRWSLQKEKNRTSHLSALGHNAGDVQCGNSIKKPNGQLQVPDLMTKFPSPLSDAKLHESFCFIGDDSSQEGDVHIFEAHDTIDFEERNDIEWLSETTSRSETEYKRSIDSNGVCEKNEYLEFSGLDVLLEDQSQAFSSDVPPSSPSSIQETEDLDGIKDRADQTSPVSVLEPFPMEDVTRPSMIVSKHSGRTSRLEFIISSSFVSQSETESNPPPQTSIDELERKRARPETSFGKKCSAMRICPLLDPAIDSVTYMEDHQFSDKYVREVVQAYGLNCDEFLEERQSPTECCNDSKLLFDCITEVVEEVYNHHFRHLPFVSFIKRKIQPVPLMEKHIVRKIMEGVDELLLHQSRQNHLQRDLKQSQAWLDIGADVEDIVTDIVEASVEALMEEAILELQQV